MNFQNSISEATKLDSIYRRASYQFITKNVRGVGFLKFWRLRIEEKTFERLKNKYRTHGFRYFHSFSQSFIDQWDSVSC